MRHQRRITKRRLQNQCSQPRRPMVFGSSRKSAAAADADAASPAAAPAAAQEKRRKKKSASDNSAATPAGAEAEEQSSQPAAKEMSALDTAVDKTKSAQELIATGGAVAAGGMSAEDVAAQHGGARTQVRKPARTLSRQACAPRCTRPPHRYQPRRTTPHLVATRQLWASPGGSQVGSR